MLNEIVTLEHIDGRVRQDLLINIVLSFNDRSITRFYYAVGKYHSVVTQFNSGCGYFLFFGDHNNFTEDTRYLYVIRDAHGKVVDPDYVVYLLSLSSKHRVLVSRSNRFSGHWRTLTGGHPGKKRRRGYSRSYRRVRTTQERRWAVQVDDMEPEIRSKRKGYSLPDSWDDICRHNERNWKSQGKSRHQYK